MEEKIWRRKLECGHYRDTCLSFFMKCYNKPKIGNNCFCRECIRDVKVIKVTVVSEKRNKGYYEWARDFRNKLNSAKP